MALEINDHPEQSRYEARQGAELAGSPRTSGATA